MIRILLVLIALLGISTEAAAQLAPSHAADVPLPSLVDDAGASAIVLRGTHPLIRTLGTLAASAGGFALAQNRSNDGPDELFVPMAASAAGAAFAGVVFSNGHPLRIIAGSILATLPAGAIALQLARTLDDEEQKNIPLISFSVPHGLLTSAFAVNRR